MCKNCKWYVRGFIYASDEKIPKSTGDCRRYSPKVLQETDCGDSRIWQGWPTVKESDFCGEFEMSDEAKLNAIAGQPS